jgi:hypothetical protein
MTVHNGMNGAVYVQCQSGLLSAHVLPAGVSPASLAIVKLARPTEELVRLLLEC